MTEIKGTQSHLGRCVSAEVRARLAAMRLTGMSLAKRMGRSQNYVAKRLRDELPFTLDDVEDIVEALELEINPEMFVTQAAERNGEEVWMQMDALEQVVKETLTLAAHHNPGKGREREARERDV